MQYRTLGPNGPRVSAIGLGCMGMSAFYGARDDAESIDTLHYALDQGVTLVDTADMYGPHTNERLVGRAIAGRRDQVFLATKFGIVLDPANPMARGINGRPEYVRASCEASLQRLGVDHIDLYYQHRIDPQVPIEETVGAMSDLCTRARCVIWACPKRRHGRWNGRIACTRSRRCKANIRYGRAIRSKPRWCCANGWASASSPTARWDAVF